jgi:hypothetical protein
MVDDCERLKRECAAMVEFLRHLERQENDLLIQNEILARECLSNGWPTELQPEDSTARPAVKKRRTTTTTTTTSKSKKKSTALTLPDQSAETVSKIDDSVESTA